MALLKRYGWARFSIGVVVAAGFAVPVLAVADEPLRTVRDAWAVSSRELRSGSGHGMFRCYESVSGGEWELKVDAEITTHFVGRNYYIELIYNPECRGLKCRRILKNDRSLRVAVFPPGWLTRGQIREVQLEDHGDGLARPMHAEFPWDVSMLSRNAWNVDLLVRRVTPQKIEIVATPEGDLVGNYPVNGDDRFRVRFECPKRFGFNVAKIQAIGPGDDRPAHEYRIEWKQADTGVWYIRSLQEDWLVRGDVTKRMRQVLKYSDFEPNATVDPGVFTAEFLGRPMGAQETGKRTD
jgi:hypothetical protein